MQITFTLNHKKVTAEIAADTVLLDLVRSLGCKSVKRGCETANCGLCTVFLDEKPVLSCSVLAARVNGRSVTTLEGLQRFTGVTDLDLSEFSALKSITPVESMASLTQINLQDTAISDISSLAKLTSLNNVSLPDHACDLQALADLPLTAVNLQCPTADITPLDGKKAQIYVPEAFDRNAAVASAQTGNIIGISQEDGSFEILQLGDDGTVTSQKI